MRPLTKVEVAEFAEVVGFVIDDLMLSLVHHLYKKDK